MPSRIVYRSKKSSRRGVVPGGQTKKVRKGASRNAAIYAYQPARIALRKLIHCFGHAIVPLRVNGSTTAYPNSLANCLYLNPIRMGDGIERRHASKAYMKDLIMSWGHGTTLSTSIPFTYSIVVIYDRENRGGGLNLTDVFAQVDPLGHQNFYTRDRYEILYRKNISVSPEYAYNGTVAYPFAGVSWSRTYGEKISIERMSTYSADIAGDYTENLKGSLWLAVFNNLPQVASNPYVYFGAQLTFIDVE